MKKDWQGALNFCKSKQWNLATTVTKQAHGELGEAINACRSKCGGSEFTSSWTAGTSFKRDENKKKIFEWAGLNKEIGSFGWQHNQPDNFKNNENCVEAKKFEGRRQIFLNDRPCSDIYNIICENQP
ncbi:C-type lectin BML-1-like [Macrosteles quadrilineatus]|uniref:C-type lectin BML-1-like n=1 Tax=Macrosteles quadrilineatus TaxID=74068 RepID=UPI0023E30911|nr:C-type lectin BML-1-like [Macrosteles quadrilineatus]